MADRPPYARSRQKSCIACAEGKRRCNRQTPQCSRCLAQGLVCTYLSAWPRQKRRNGSRQLESSHISDVGPELSPVSNETLSFWPLNDFASNDTSVATSWLTSMPSLLTLPSLSPAAFFPETTIIDKWSTNQLLHNIKRYPQVFVSSRKTPFIHSRLYDAYLPDSIQDAFTVLAAYSTKTSETEDLIFRILESKTTNLVDQDHHTSILPQLLAAVHALMLFQIIQLFDGDIRQRSLAEQHMNTLKIWTFQLQERAGELTPALTWREWIFAESARRTIIFVMMIESLYLTLKTGCCPNVRAMSILPFTSKTTLWDLSTSASWFAEPDQLRSEIVLYGDFARGWQEGQVPGRLDAFQKLLLIPCLGERYRDLLELDC
ncbi:hypothetical protein N7509_002372 [Penicillium cosmopolitanum]|uniref:Zn(2)-C6 fungal-type domain-containing protein n=1 Tax=Penicillium cosmopolitanum TaxID=1131564 RepID=A0A9W9W8Y2_9EURO|nr:uncharacterized protein N7509_002372 [Penicillium cosmopolitanum]KAJ5408489.1 hypothetical protein N7509_002372 [Penicillium cosmopolitanum]